MIVMVEVLVMKEYNKKNIQVAKMLRKNIFLIK